MAFIGMSTDQASAQAERTDTGAQQLEQLAEELGSAVVRSSEFWIGADAEAFRASWSSTAQALRTAAGDLITRSGELSQHRDEQESASESDGTAASSGAGDEAGSATGPSAQDGPNAPGEEPYYGKVDPEVAERWESMSKEDREAVARAIIEEELEQYGIEDVPIDFALTDGNGLWSFGEEGHSISINGSVLDTPRLLHTLAHEARHAAQWEAVQDTEPGFWDWLPGVDSTADDYERLEEEHGFTREEIDSWREHWEASEEEKDPYYDRSVEVDARNAGAEFSEELTMEDLDRYEERAGVR
ncbi:hypothetical protein Y09_0480 [Brachybacterium sp. SW0106-09]|nr:hypothetical protein Y09_0480 [Brachybacterium sp. SW0106-09]